MTRKYIYTNITKAEFEALDKTAENLGFVSRTDLFTACAHILIYGALKNKETPDATAGLAIASPCLTERDTSCPAVLREFARLHTISEKIAGMQQTFMDILNEKAFPIIAMKGIATAEHTLKDDIKRLMYERCGMVPEDIEIHEWFRIFKNIHTAELLQYRSKQFIAAITGDAE